MALPGQEEGGPAQQRRTPAEGRLGTRTRGRFRGPEFYGQKSNNPEVLYGRDFEDDFLEIEKIDGEMGEVTLRGKILTCESRELRSGKFILTFDM